MSALVSAYEAGRDSMLATTGKRTKWPQAVIVTPSGFRDTFPRSETCRAPTRGARNSTKLNQSPQLKNSTKMRLKLKNSAKAVKHSKIHQEEQASVESNVAAM